MFTQLIVLLRLIVLGACTIYGKVDDVPRLTWDFIIVGGGTAGSVLADRLTENPSFNVLVLEAGPTNEGVLNSIVPGFSSRTANSPFDWNFTTVPQKGLNGRSVALQRGHILGGTSSVNGMVYTRGPSSDFDRFATVTGDPGWSWSSVQKYIKKQEKFETPADNHNTEGQYDPKVHSSNGKVPVTLPGFLSPAIDSAIIKAGQQLGGDFQPNLDMNSGTPLGLGWLQSTIGHDGTRSSAATSYLAATTRSRKNLHIVTNTRAMRVLNTPGANGLTFRTVEIRPSKASESTYLTATKEVILAGGSIGTPHILLHSGIGDQQDLKAFNISTVLHNPSVGRNLSDHPHVIGLFGLVPNKIDVGPWDNLSSDLTLQDEALKLWKATGTGPYVSPIPGANHIAWTRLPDDSPIIKKFGDPSSGRNSAHIELTLGMTAEILGGIIVVATPTSRGSVTIGSNDPFDDPLIDPQLFASEFDLSAAREGIKKFIKYAHAPSWRGIVAGPLDPLTDTSTDAELEEIIRNTGESGLHPIGTASMSPRNANWGVVDPDLLVKGASGLRIVDASIMPYIPSAHPQIPVYVIAERAADMVRSIWY